MTDDTYLLLPDYTLLYFEIGEITPKPNYISQTMNQYSFELFKNDYNVPDFNQTNIFS
jgi:hypothetical protein